jgi:hypothetical protein
MFGVNSKGNSHARKIDPAQLSNVDVTPQGRHPGQSNSAIEKGVDRPDHTLRR